MSIFSKKPNKPTRQEIMSSHLLDVRNNTELSNSLTALQNEITVSFDMKVIAITSINRNKLSAGFAKGLADTFALNGSNALIIDANLYDPRLAMLLNAEVDENSSLKKLDEGVDVVYLTKETYPPQVFKGGTIQKIIKDNFDKYEHIIIIVPSITEHKEIVLLSKVIDSVILLAQRNVTKRVDLYEAISYCYDNKLPLAKTVVVK